MLYRETLVSVMITGTIHILLPPGSLTDGKLPCEFLGREILSQREPCPFELRINLSQVT